MLLAIAARDNVRVHQYDMSTAFLHATPTVYGSMLNGDMCPATSDEKLMLLNCLINRLLVA